MDTRKFIQNIIDNELTMCFADCSKDNIDKWVEILERYKEQLLIHSVVGRSEQFCPNCYSRNVIAWGPDANKCQDCELTWDV